jgi:hypothetical protein
MDRGVANTVKTLAFCLSTPSVRTRIHFFPSGGSVGGAAAVNCSLKLFGKGFESRSVLLDGGRIGQPDGVRLEDAFPNIRSEGSGIVGLEVLLECPQGQGRINLQSSHATIELVSPQFSIAYGSAPFVALREGEQGSITERLIAARRRNRVAAAIHDSLITTSLVVINPSSEPLRPEVTHTVGEADVALPLGTVAPESVVEIPLDESLFKGKESQQCLWGEVCAAKIAIAEYSGSADSGYYLVYREPNTKRPIAVCAL